MSDSGKTSIPRFRWRIIPAFATFGLFCLVVILFCNNVVVGQVPVLHKAHFLIFVAGFSWLLASALYAFGKFRIANFLTIVGFALPFFRQV